MLDEYLVDTCYKVQTVSDAYGDILDIENSEVIPCRFRYNSSYVRGANQQTKDTSAMIWVASSSGISRSTYILYDGVYYKVERIIKARRLGETEVQFIKCELNEVNIAVS